MRTAIVYYSFSGNTNKVAHIAVGVLREKNENAVPVRIRPLKEEKNFILQCKDAFLGKKPELYETLLDLKDFDKIMIGSPVWAFKPAPAINTYLDKCSSLEGKEVIVFVTYGSGVGKEKTLDAMKKILLKKGAKVNSTLSFQQGETEDIIKEKLKKAL